MISRNVVMALCLAAAIALMCPGANALSLEEAVGMALESSESAGIIGHDTRASREAADAGVSPLKPQIKLEGGYYRLGTDAAPIPFIPQYDRNYEATLSAAQLLWAGGRITRGFRLRSTLQGQASLQERIRLSELRYRATTMYYKALFEKARLDVLRTVASQRAQELSDATALVEAGLAGQLDARHAKVARNMAEAEANQGEVDYMQALVDLNIEIGADVSGDSPLMEPEGELAGALGMSGAMDELQEMVSLGSLPELEMSTMSLKEAELRKSMANGRLFPELTLVASTTSSGPEPSLMDESWAAGINLKFDFYDGGMRGAQRARAESLKRKAMLERQRDLKLIRGRVMSMRMRAEALKKSIGLGQEAVGLSEQNYEDARARYREGLITISELGQYNLALSNSRLSLLGLYLGEQMLLGEVDFVRGRGR